MLSDMTSRPDWEPAVRRRSPRRTRRFPERLLSMGVQIGQRRAPTSFAVVELVLREREHPEPHRSGKKEWHFLVRFLERLPQGLSFMEVARRLRELCAGVEGRAGSKPTLFVDVTGLGEPVTDLLKDEVEEVQRIREVYFTHGDRRTEEKGRDHVTLGKGYLVSRLQALLQRDRLHLPPSPEARTLAVELLEYEIETDEHANDRYGAFQVGSHDDLVTALGLAVQKDPDPSVYPTIVSYGL